MFIWVLEERRESLKVTAKTFPKPVKGSNSQIQEARQALSSMNTKKAWAQPSTADQNQQ